MIDSKLTTFKSLCARKVSVSAQDMNDFMLSMLTNEAFPSGYHRI